MSRVAYSATKDIFIRDVLLNKFIPKMCEGARLNHIGGAESEIRSWQNNAPNVRNLLELSRVPNDIIVSFEYKVPNGGRIDCMLYGVGKNNLDNVIHIELKQWSNNSVQELYDNGVFMVDAFVGGTYRPVCHPSQQVANYQTHLLNFIEELNTVQTNLEGVAYCYNYNSQANPNALYANHYRAILDKHNLYSGDEIENLAQRLHELLCNGSGLEIFNRITSSRIRQSKTLIDAAANMFQGITEFSLLDDQITASETIFAEVKRAYLKKGEKTVIIVKGGPGTGKTVIALHVLAQMAQKGNASNMYFTTRSKALRESLKLQLQNVTLENGNVANASDMIANIFHFKPFHFAEGEVDLLLVDEAHRVQQSANYMGDKFYEQTYLPQVVSLMYCSKVCVFFIDDNQAIKSDEIGNSHDIKEAALKYKEYVNNHKESDFYKKLLKTKKSLEKNIEKRKELAILYADDTTKQLILSKLDEKIAEQQRELTKEDCINHVVSHLNSSIQIIELGLKSQVRCNGSDNYLDWLDEVLYRPSNLVNARFSKGEYDFRIFDSPHKLYEKIKSLDAPHSNPKQIARIAAGYCWRWSTTLMPNGDLVKDVRIGDFEMPWETNNVRAKGEFRDLYASSADTWAIEPQGINQIGCIFSIQGFEIDYIGVILGPDIKYDEENDCLVGVMGNNIAVTSNDPETYNRHIRNAYRVLMSRGKRGCFIYSCDPKVSAFFMKCMEQKIYDLSFSQEISIAAEPEKMYPRIITEEEYSDLSDKTNFLPLYSLRAACGVFEGEQDVSTEGWVDVSNYGFRANSHKHFVVHAKGNSMLPKIKDGDLCVFEWYKGGSRNGEIVLVQCQDYDTDYSARYTIKKYYSEKQKTEESWEHQKIELHPLNRDGYNTIILEESDENQYLTIGTLKKVL